MKSFFSYLSEAVQSMQNEDDARAIAQVGFRYRVLRLIEKVAKKSADAIKPELSAYWERYGRKYFQAHGEQPIDGIQFVDVVVKEKTVETRTIKTAMLHDILEYYNAGNAVTITEDDLFEVTIETTPASTQLRINSTDPNAEEKLAWQKQFLLEA